MQKIIAIHQPECLPWIGYFNKMMLADEYIILDDVQYCKRNFQNRNQIQLNGKKHYLTIPVNSSLSSIIKDVKIADTSYIDKHLKTIQRAYGKTPYFPSFFPQIERLYLSRHQFLLDFNLSFIQLIRDFFKISTPLHLASKFDVKVSKTNRITQLIQNTKGSKYITGTVSLNYLNPSEFVENDIELFIHQTNPVYKNKGKPAFISHLSIIDLLMQYAPDEAKEIILQSGTSIPYDTFIADINNNK
ncbi:WbqC family protein [bacterium]|nr:WbqC family protein [bacterium]